METSLEESVEETTELACTTLRPTEVAPRGSWLLSFTTFKAMFMPRTDETSAENIISQAPSALAPNRLHASFCKGRQQTVRQLQQGSPLLLGRLGGLRPELSRRVEGVQLDQEPLTLSLAGPSSAGLWRLGDSPLKGEKKLRTVGMLPTEAGAVARFELSNSLVDGLTTEADGCGHMVAATRPAMALAARMPLADDCSNPLVIPAPSPTANRLATSVSISGETVTRLE
jgi:hypothetical protein